MEVSSVPLRKINQWAQKGRFDLAELKFSDSRSNQQVYWAPERLAPLCFLPSYQKLSQAQQLRYNQLFALGIVEQFIWFEGDLISVVLENVLKTTTDLELQQAIQDFRVDEEKHSEMFWRLLQSAAPELYASRKFAFFSVSKWQSFFIQQMLATPTSHLVWIWMAIFFEERTMHFSQLYGQAKRAHEEVHPDFMQAHLLHLQDEARHFQMDVHFLKNYYDGQSWLKRLWAGIQMRMLMLAYVRPHRVTIKILEQMQREFPDLGDELRQRLQAELKTLPHNKEFLERSFGTQAVPRSRELMKKYPEMRAILDYFTGK